MTPSLSTVRAWAETLTLPTYPVGTPEPNPMFFEIRNVQGSNGRIYPNPMTDQISDQKIDRAYQAVYLENEYIQMIMIPELGGRIFAGRDLTNGYDFFYRHRVIKPALIGTFGAWISGGVEFNWPQHHKPSTFMPVDWTIEEHSDGSKTVWMSEHDPLYRTKGMVGICLYPGKAFVETKVRLYNRTTLPESFLWWENAAVHINEAYEVFFPPDVHSVIYHTKTPVTQFPIASGEYGSLHFDRTDLRYYKNFPVPSSFFSTPSRYNFFGGYDHRAQAGTIHYADRHYAVGKKYFTWGNGPFGHQWQHNLTDFDDPYLELMAGSYTDNQPDFSWIQPHETRTFSQFWYPVQKIGDIQNATLEAALHLEIKDGSALLGVYATRVITDARVRLTKGTEALFEQAIDLQPGAPFLSTVELSSPVDPFALELSVLRSDGSFVISYRPETGDSQLPEPYQAPLPPASISTIEELYLTGLHLEQYRHPIWPPEPYWEEALQRDPNDARTNTAIGRLYLRRGMFAQSEEHLRRAIARLTVRNFNPEDNAANYYLGLNLVYQGRFSEALDAFGKATWDAAWSSSAYQAMSEIECRSGDYSTAFVYVEKSLAANAQSLHGRDLKAALLRHLGKASEAEALARETLALDPLDHRAANETALALYAQGKKEEAAAFAEQTWQRMRCQVQTVLDIVYDYSQAGLADEARGLLLHLVQPISGEPVTYPMLYYTLGYLAETNGNPGGAKAWYDQAAQMPPDYCFPVRLEEMLVLEAALKANPADARAHYYLGNLLFDKKQHAAGMQHWLAATHLDPGFSIPWRNLGLASFNFLKDIQASLTYYRRALEVNQSDPRLLYELDQVEMRAGTAPEARLERFQAHMDLVNQRDDLFVELAVLYNRLDQPHKALQVLGSRHFHLWEGGESMMLEQANLAHWKLGRAALEHRDPQAALREFEAGLELPEARALTLMPVILSFYQGLALEACGNGSGAAAIYNRLASLAWSPGPAACYQALAKEKLGRREEAREQLEALVSHAEEHMHDTISLDYFYPQMPSATFEDDLDEHNTTSCLFLLGLANLWLGNRAEAARALADVLARNPSHPLAHEELERMLA